MQSTMIDFASGVVIGGLALSACWGWLWLVIGAVGFSRGVCGGRVVVNSLTVGIVPLLLGSWVWWVRHDIVSSNAAVLAGLCVMPLLAAGLGLRKASDGRRAGHHMAEGIRHLKDELLGAHHECGGCAHGPDADREGGCP
jgi:hypothetical protein